jgi:phosphoglycerate dehydrogenase-like enzyme
MHIVFHGQLAAAFANGFDRFLAGGSTLTILPDTLTSEADRRAYSAADVIVSFTFNRALPRPEGLMLLQVPGAGFDAVDFEALPAATVVCNAFGHEQAIAEYAMAALLLHQIPFVAADARLRQGDWAYRGGSSESLHAELADQTIGLLGFGHIGRALAIRAKAFEMRVHVANRSPVPTSAEVDRGFSLTQLTAFWGSATFFVVSLPLTPETTGIVGADAFAAMPRDAVVVNVGRGAVIEERALYNALKDRRIAGAVIDTWYNYPSATEPSAFPSALPFHELPNVVMTPHMAGWAQGTIRRRQRTIADNIARRMSGQPCVNVVWPVGR